MARPVKMGLDYSIWDVRIFQDDERFDELIDGQGWTGFAIYFFLCQEAYAVNGYYLKWSFNNAARTARKMGGGVKADTVKQAVSLCLRLGLFNNRLFDRESVLSSRGLQKGWMNAVEKRAVNGRIIDPKIWLLKKEETKSFICVPENGSFLSENPDFLPENFTERREEKNKSIEEKNRHTMFAYADSIIEAWNGLSEYGIAGVSHMTDRREAMLTNLIAEYGVENIFKAVNLIPKSDFLTGKVNSWKISFDFFLNPNNFVRVLEGNYSTTTKKATSKKENHDQRQYDDELLNGFVNADLN